jgi:non-specific serine/threonine protein kinase
MAEEARGALRYHLLETVREYALERLAEAGEGERVRRRHATFFLALAERAEPAMLRAGDAAAADGLEAEHDNLRAALEWCLTAGGEAEADAALRLAGALAWFWWTRNHHNEGRRWLARALAASPGRSAARMKALHGAGWLAHRQRDGATARALLEESLAIARALDDRWTVAWALHVLGRVAVEVGDAATARRLGEESLAVAEGVGDRWLIAWAVHLLGLAAHITADYPAARAHYDRSLAIRRKLGDQESIGVLLSLLSLVAYREGDLPVAITLKRDALAAYRAIGATWQQVGSLAEFAILAAAQQQPERAARLAGAYAALSERSHTPQVPLTEAILTEALTNVRTALGEAAFAAACAEGRALSLEQATAEMLAVTEAPAASPGGPARETAGAARTPDGLTAREVEVLRLLVGGASNQVIAESLVLSIKTVQRHIANIYAKIGARGRVDATAYAMQHGISPETQRLHS